MSLLREYNRVYIIVDALDECLDTNNTSTELLDRLFEVQHWPKTSVAVLLTTSSVPEVIARFQTSPNIGIRAHDEDVHQNLLQHIGELKVDPQKVVELTGARMTVQQAMTSRITRPADGMSAQP